MEMKPVESSHIAAIGYDPETQTMRVQFRGAGMPIYEAVGVPAEEHAAFMEAKSHGRRWHAAFRNNENYKFSPVPMEG